MWSVLTKHLLAKYGAAVRECVEANVADYELVNPQLTAVYAASLDDSLATRGLCLFLVCQKIEHPFLKNTDPQHGRLPVVLLQHCTDANFDITSPDKQEFCSTSAQRHGKEPT